MSTLDKWQKFLNIPMTVQLPRLELIGRDHAPSIVVGAGEVRMESLNEFTFMLSGVPENIGYALAELNKARQNPYDGLARPRLVGTDDQGIEWAGGYTVPTVETKNGIWIFSGEIEGLITDVQGTTVSPQATTELLLPLRVGDPMALEMARFVRTDVGGTWYSDYELEILESKIKFRYDAAAGWLSITAMHSPELPATYTENWLCEPLRILFGQLIFPRLVARNYGDGRAIIFIRRMPSLIRGARWAALWGPDDRPKDDSVFWSRYSMLLGMIARARDTGGNRNFDQHKITRIYEEVIQAARGSRWVWALTFASGIEALVNMLIPAKTVPSLVETKIVTEMITHIKAGPGDKRLKAIAANALHRTLNVSTIRMLRELQDKAVISESQLSAWQKTRNSVAHGSLLSHYSNEEEDARLLALSAMMHAVTNEVLHRTFEKPTAA